MKKVLFLALFLIFAVTATAGDAYKAYYAARAEAKACEKAGDITCAVAKYLAAETAAINQDATKSADDTVDWQTIADWQRNNAAYCLIKSQADGPTRDLNVLKQALAILTAREIKSAAVIPTAKKNADYCLTQIGN